MPRKLAACRTWPKPPMYSPTDALAVQTAQHKKGFSVERHNSRLKGPLYIHFDPCAVQPQEAADF